MALSWNEIKSRAVAFSKEWADVSSEDAEAKSFWDSFFNVFGISRRRVANFEQKVKKIDGKDGYMDLLWKGVILIEHKSRGKDLSKAYQQARDYFPGLTEDELPRYILVSDFARFRLYDLDEGTQREFALNDLVNQVSLFGFIAGYQKQTYKEQDPVNIQAAEWMGRLHDKLKAVNYTGHALEVYLVRLLFCLFADDSGIFEKNMFREYIEKKTRPDGSDLAFHLDAIFQVCDTPIEKRLKNLDENLAAIPYINGKLFQERLPIAGFDSDMRNLLLNCCTLDWGRISPAIFGSLFQSVMNPTERRNLGAHYTSEANILKLIRPLFLDDLWSEFAAATGSRPKLERLHKKIASIKFFDPACGCGNFLVIAYRELRLLELQLLRELLKGQMVLDIGHLVQVDVDQFYGIEVEEFPSQIAQVALWLMDHQMNMIVSQEFGEYFVRLPLYKSPTIINGNSLDIEWHKAAPCANYILGNPPFVGSKFLNTAQKADMEAVFNGIKGAGILDYVSAWYIRAAQYIQISPALVAFVSTNSITQGEQVGVLWQEMLNRYRMVIRFAHRTFRWNNEAKGMAAVHCVIVGFGLDEPKEKFIFDYDQPEAEAHVVRVKNINPYLVDGPNIFLPNRQTPICNVPRIGIGNKPIDGGYYLFTEEGKREFAQKEPAAEKWFRPWIGSDEFINGYRRWCLWLGQCPPEELRKMPEAMKRVEAVRRFRLASKSLPTQKIAAIPTHFHVENRPIGDYLVIPKVSSERRQFIPMGFLPPDVLSSDLVHIVSGATLYHFGVLTSTMHMAWVRHVCGRLESRYRYSGGIVYNNFPWPEPTEKRKAAIEKAAQAVLDARELYPTACLADLYDPLSMPHELVKAHDKLDRAVELAYGKSFKSDAERVAFLFERYQELEQA